ncbi:MAG: hypothetical protein WCC10_00985 [Tumebacillaceae bacterium]
MEITFNPDLSIEDFEDGKIIMEIESMETVYMELGVFELLAPALEAFREVRSLFPDIYEEDEYQPFVQQLIDMRILLHR